MVTLLLCFFVLLYSISSVDQDKWKNFVLSINPQAAEALQEREQTVHFRKVLWMNTLKAMRMHLRKCSGRLSKRQTSLA
nr:flagellar motor protein MotB [Eisenbergiella tayi]